MRTILTHRISYIVLSMVIVTQICRGAGPDIHAVKNRVEDEGYTFEVGDNPATQYSLEQLCGYKPPEHPIPIQQKAPLPPQDLPDHFDWRELYGCTPVKNQGPCGSCWAFASLGVVESQYLINGNVEMDFSEQWLVSCTEAGSCNGGSCGPAFSYMLDTEDSCGGIGTVLESVYPYEAKDADCSCPSDERYMITNWSGLEQNIDTMKQAIMTYGPIAVAVAADDLFQCYIGGIFNADVSTDINHAVVLVGWDDTLGSNGIWYLRNSWGTGWGESGYMRIEYGCNMVGSGPVYAEWVPEDDPNMLEVPDQYPTLAAAMEQAGGSDIITLQPGVYTGPDNTNVDFGGKNVTIRSINPGDPCIVAATVIDCQGGPANPGRAFLFSGNEGPETLLYGLTIRNGYVNDNGGAVYCYYSNPTFKNCVFENNSANGYKKAGGAIALYNSSPQIINCRIEGNTSSYYGGGISCRDGSSPLISRCRILDNTAGIEGGGIYFWVNCIAELEHSVIAGNRIENSAGTGGGLYYFECTQGLEAEEPNIISCTIADNYAGSIGGGLFVMDSTVNMNSSILWNNECGDPLGEQITLIDDALDGTRLRVNYCDVTGLDQGHLLDPPLSAECELEWGEGNFDLDPLFVDSAANDYHLKSASGHWNPDINDWVLDDGGNFDSSDDENSPCIDAGDPELSVAREQACNGDRINVGAYGGTAQASRSPDEKCCMMCLHGDFNCDCVIDLQDIMVLMEQWLECNFLPRHHCG